ncbi:TerB family tellurite resistance protein [Candidatus Auribacterota bacterium]
MRYNYNNYKNEGIGCFWPMLLLILLFGGFRSLFFIFNLFFLFFPLILLGLFAFLFLNVFLRQKTIRNFVNSQTVDHNKFVELLIHILVKIAKADGTVDRQEIKAMREYFQYQLRLSREELLWTKELIKKSIKEDQAISIDELCSEFKQSFAYEPRLILATLMYKVAFADGEYSQSEKALIEKIIRLLEISDHHHRTIKSQFLKVDEEQKYYATLGLSKEASFTEIKKAYRELSIKYHPDKISHLGKEFSSVSQEKMKEINEAYNYFKKKFSSQR